MPGCPQKLRCGADSTPHRNRGDSHAADRRLAVFGAAAVGDLPVLSWASIVSHPRDDRTRQAFPPASRQLQTAGKEGTFPVKRPCYGVVMGSWSLVVGTGAQMSVLTLGGAIVMGGALVLARVHLAM